MWHYSVHFFAGFIETSSISFLSIFYLSVGYAVGAATAMLASFRLGNAILQLPLGWLVDKKSPLFSFALVGFVLLVCSTTLLFSLPIWRNAAIVFIFGGCVGGLNTLAVLDAGAKVEHGQISTAMTFIAIFYTAGSVIGPHCNRLGGFIPHKIRASCNNDNFHIAIFVLFISTKNAAEGKLAVKSRAFCKIERAEFFY